jgi:Fur family ferric uptake transcriptional regulator
MPTETGSERRPGSDTAWAERALRELGQRGHRAGGARTAVIELLAAEGGCLEAPDVAERIRGHGRRVGTASVYRALSLLCDLGLLHKLALPEAPVRYELVRPGGEHHHHIVCDECGKTVVFSDERLEAAIAEVSRRAAFEVQAHDITLHGRCQSCQDAE